MFGWLTVYGTHIDYPLVQGTDNETYVNTSVTGEKVLSGSLFLDARNQPGFQDFNSIIYGHHMAKQVMFGEIGDFARQSYFEEHRYGKLYFDGTEKGIEFFTFLAADTYDTSIYSPGVTGQEQKSEYLRNLLKRGMYTREIGIRSSDQLVLLSTCSTEATNGRHILVGRISDTVYEDPFAVSQSVWDLGEENIWNRLVGLLNKLSVRNWMIISMILLIGIVILVVLGIFPSKKRKRRENEET